MDAILPLRQRDLPRATLLLCSLCQRAHGIGTLWIVCPDNDILSIRQNLQRFGETFTINVLPETKIVPELQFFTTLNGWRKQQIIKLAIADWVNSDFYLTLDADVVCTRHVQLDNLIVDGRAPCLVHQDNFRRDYYISAERVLGMCAPRPHIFHNVTPAILSKDVMKRLQRHLTGRWDNFFRSLAFWPLGRRAVNQCHQRLKFGRQPPAPLCAWRLYLAASVPWTEYAVYYTFSESSGIFHDFFLESNIGIYDFANSIWYKEDFEQKLLQLNSCFDGKGPPYFIIVQSNTHIDITYLNENIKPLLLIKKL